MTSLGLLLSCGNSVFPELGIQGSLPYALRLPFSLVSPFIFFPDLRESGQQREREKHPLAF